QHDFDLDVNNCKLYNAPNSYDHKEAMSIDTFGRLLMQGLAPKFIKPVEPPPGPIKRPTSSPGTHAHWILSFFCEMIPPQWVFVSLLVAAHHTTPGPSHAAAREAAESDKDGGVVPASFPTTAVAPTQFPTNKFSEGLCTCCRFH